MSVDPRDQRWELDNPAFRVYFWRGSDDRGWASDEWELSEADIDEVLDWTSAHAAGRSMSVWAVIRDEQGLGLVRLAGIDPTAAPSTWPTWATPRRG